MQTNKSFANRVGIHYTYASRLRSGDRLPSAEVLVRIIREFDLPTELALDAFTAGPQQFSRFLNENVFDREVA